MFVTMLTMAPLIFSLGLEQAYVREYHEAKDKQRLFALCFIPGGILLAVAIGFASIMWEDLATVLYAEDSWLLFVCTAGASILTFANTFLSNTLRMQERGLPFSLSQVVPKLLLAAALGAAFLVSAAPSFAFLAVSQALALTLATSYLLYVTWPEWRRMGFKPFAASELKPLLNFSLQLQLSNALFWGLTATNVLFLRYYADLSEVGLYATAVGLAGLAVVVKSMFTVVWMPMVYKWNATGDALPQIKVALNPSTFGVCLLIAFAGLMSGLVTIVLPEHLWETRYFIAACFIHPLLYALSEVTVVGIPLTRKTHYAIYVVSGAAAVNVFACVALIPSYGAAGAAIANALAFAVFFLLRSELSCRVWHRLPLTRSYVAVTLVVLMACMQATWKSREVGIVVVLWATSIGLLVYIFRNDVFQLMRRIKPGVAHG